MFIPHRKQQGVLFFPVVLFRLFFWYFFKVKKNKNQTTKPKANPLIATNIVLRVSEEELAAVPGSRLSARGEARQSGRIGREVVKIPYRENAS